MSIHCLTITQQNATAFASIDHSHITLGWRAVGLRKGRRTGRRMDVRTVVATIQL